MAKSARKSKQAAVTTQFDMTATVGDEILSSAHADVLIPGVNLDEIFGDLNDEIVEQAAAEPHPTELEMEAAVSAAEQAESIQAVYAEQGAVDELLTAPAADVPSTESEEKPKKEKKAKAPKEPRLSYVLSKKSEIVAARVPTGIVLEVADASLSAAELLAKQDEFLASIDALPKKVGEKAVQFFTDFAKYISASDVKNEVIRRAVQLLIKEGELTSGDKGNLQADLLAKPYSLGTARSQANQMFALLPALKMTVREKGRMIANPDSLLMAVMRGEA